MGWQLGFTGVITMKTPGGVSKEAFLESYVSILRRAADVWESEAAMSKELAYQLLATAMEMNMAQALREKGKLGNYFPELEQRIKELMPMMKSMGEGQEAEIRRRMGELN